MFNWIKNFTSELCIANVYCKRNICTDVQKDSIDDLRYQVIQNLNGFYIMGVIIFRHSQEIVQPLGLICVSPLRT